MLAREQIQALTKGQTISNEWPWSTNSDKTITKYLKCVVAELRQRTGVRDKTEYNHYGSGYASFVDCWLYRKMPTFKFDRGNCYWGLVVLLSRLSNYYVIGEGQKTWQLRGSSSYLPAFGLLRRIEHPAVAAIVDEVCNVLDERGLVRLSAADLADYLEPDLEVPTILSEAPWQHFDALFYWED